MTGPRLAEKERERFDHYIVPDRLGRPVCRYCGQKVPAEVPCYVCRSL
jgi:hypothetical protein